MRLYRYEDIKKNMISLTFSNDVWISSTALSLTVPTVKAYTKDKVKEIQLDIEELEQPTMDEEGYTFCQSECLDIIQHKINELKGVNNE